jgi:cell division cycle 2-like protein
MDTYWCYLRCQLTHCRMSAPTSTRSSASADDAGSDSHNPLLHGCRSVETYQQLGFIAQGTYGKVFEARNRLSGERVAIKRVKIGADADKDGFPITALRETNVLLSLRHPNILRVHEMVVGKGPDGERIYMVMEYFDTDLKALAEKRRKVGEHFTVSEVKCLTYQLLSGIAHLHRHWYLHRDIKTSNLLYNSHGRLALGDFGLARRYEDPIRPYTRLVVTLWYRCPELLLGAREYNTAVDTWSAGCVMGELLHGEAIFPGQGDVDQLSKIFAMLGAPSEDRWPGWSSLPGASIVRWKQGPRSRLAEAFPSTAFASGKPCLTPVGRELLAGLLHLDPNQRW